MLLKPTVKKFTMAVLFFCLFFFGCKKIQIGCFDFGFGTGKNNWYINPNPMGPDKIRDDMSDMKYYHRNN